MASSLLFPPLLIITLFFLKAFQKLSTEYSLQFQPPGYEGTLDYLPSICEAYVPTSAQNLVRTKSGCLSWQIRLQPEFSCPCPLPNIPVSLKLRYWRSPGTVGNDSQGLSNPPPVSYVHHTQVSCAACHCLLFLLSMNNEPSFLPANPSLLWRSHFNFYLHLKLVLNSLTWATWPSCCVSEALCM